MSKSPIVLFAFALCSMGCTLLTQLTEANTGQHPQSFKAEITKTLRANYLLYIPDQYPTSLKEWPLILFLHGSGERGSDLSKVEDHGIPKLIAKEGKNFPFVIASPQCPKNSFWDNELQIDILSGILDDVLSQYRIDKDKIYVTGLSMGGFGTWGIAEAYPNRFAGIAPICGGGDPENAESIAHLPIWVFHGANDPRVPLRRSEEMVTALQKAGSKVKFTVYPDTGHNAWTETYNNPDLYEWFLKHSRQPIESE